MLPAASQSSVLLCRSGGGGGVSPSLALQLRCPCSLCGFYSVIVGALSLHAALPEFLSVRYRSSEALVALIGDVCSSLTSVKTPPSEVLRSILRFFVLLSFSAAPQKT